MVKLCWCPLSAREMKVQVATTFERLDGEAFGATSTSFASSSVLPLKD